MTDTWARSCLNLCQEKICSDVRCCRFFFISLGLGSSLPSSICQELIFFPSGFSLTDTWATVFSSWSFKKNLFYHFAFPSALRSRPSWQIVLGVWYSIILMSRVWGWSIINLGKLMKNKSWLAANCCYKFELAYDIFCPCSTLWLSWFELVNMIH